MAESGIPADYWGRELSGFYGDLSLGNAVKEYVSNLPAEFSKGRVLCLAGPRGTGKTMLACSILKAAIMVGHTTFFTSLTEAVDELVSDGRRAFRAALRERDFMVLDEVDRRHFSSPGSRDLHSQILEEVVRTRTQNRLPLVLCTNEGNPASIVGGEWRKSMESLCAQFFQILPASGEDARKGKERNG